MVALPELSGFWCGSAYRRIYARAALAGDPCGLRPSIVLVHGLGVSGTYLVPVARQLASSHRVYVPDLPGTGRSDKPRRVLGVAELTDALAGWMNARRIERPVLLGQSMGCQVIVDLACRFPLAAQRLVLVSPTFDPAARSAVKQLLRLQKDAFHETLGLIAVASTDYVRAGPLRVLRTLHLALRDRIERKLPRVDMPTLVVTGSRDPIAPPAWAAQAAALVPRGRFALIPGGPHGVNYSQPGDLAGIVRDFLKTP